MFKAGASHYVQTLSNKHRLHTKDLQILSSNKCKLLSLARGRDILACIILWQIAGFHVSNYFWTCATFIYAHAQRESDMPPHHGCVTTSHFRVRIARQWSNASICSRQAALGTRPCNYTNEWVFIANQVLAQGYYVTCLTSKLCNKTSLSLFLQNEHLMLRLKFSSN